MLGKVRLSRVRMAILFQATSYVVILIVPLIRNWVRMESRHYDDDNAIRLSTEKISCSVLLARRHRTLMTTRHSLWINESRTQPHR